MSAKKALREMKKKKDIEGEEVELTKAEGK